MSLLRDEIQKMVWEIEARIDGLAEPNLDDQRFLTLGQAMLEVLDTLEAPAIAARMLSRMDSDPQ